MKAKPDLTLFQNPYVGIEDGSPNWLRVNVDVQRDDVYRIRTVLPEHGAVQVAITLFVKSLSDYVKNKQFLPLDPDARIELIEHILDCTVSAATVPDIADAVGDAADATSCTCDGRSTPNPNREGGGRDDRRGTPPLREGDKSTPNVKPARRRKPSAETSNVNLCE